VGERNGSGVFRAVELTLIYDKETRENPLFFCLLGCSPQKSMLIFVKFFVKNTNIPLPKVYVIAPLLLIF
jgi:hypothetical protein